MEKRKCPAMIVMTFSCAVIALTIVAFYNQELLAPRIYPYSSLLASRSEPQFSSLLDGRYNCTLYYISVGDSAIEPRMNCSCVEERCAPIVVTETVMVMPPVADKELTKSGNISSELGVIPEKDSQAPIAKNVAEEVKPSEENSADLTHNNVVELKPWYVQNKTWHYPALFPRCSMDACFNFSRCDEMSELKVFTYDIPSPPLRYFSGINDTKYFTDDPDEACLFFIFLDGPTQWNPHPRELPHWNNGLNHVLIIFSDLWNQRGPPQDSIGLASVMASDIHETTYRAGFDISIPLPANYRMEQYLDLEPFGRKYFLTFRGLRYVGKGEGMFRSYDSFRNIHNGEDIIVATSCKHSTNDYHRQREPELGVHCDEDQKIHDATDFVDLMNSTFGLVPAGRQPSSYRFSEVLSAGSIPVLIADNYVKPFDTLIQWHKCLIQFPTTELHRVVKSLRAIPKENVLKRQRNCIAFYREFLRDDSSLLKSSIRSLNARFMGVFPALVDILG